MQYVPIDAKHLIGKVKKAGLHITGMASRALESAFYIIFNEGCELTKKKLAQQVAINIPAIVAKLKTEVANHRLNTIGGTALNRYSDEICIEVLDAIDLNLTHILIEEDRRIENVIKS
jgi:hypothetical protein